MIREDAILAALAAGLTQREAAERGGASLRSVERRMADEAYRARVQEVGKKARDLQGVYTALTKARDALAAVIGLYNEEEMFDTTIGEAIRHLRASVEWLDEWAWLLEEECAG